MLVFIAWLTIRLGLNLKPALPLDVASALSVFAPTLWHSVQQARLRRRLIQNDYKLCTHCAHSLAGIGDAGLCPECGRAFILDADREAWAWAGLAPRAPRA